MEIQRKAESLDNALLFAIGLITFIITMLQINLNDLNQVIETIPFIILGILLPFIVGYLKGAIELNSIEERMRGWIYFIIGTFSYFAFFVISRIKMAYIFTESIFLIILLFGAILTYILLKWSVRVFNIENPSIQYSFSGTALGAASCAWLLRMLTGVYSDFQVNPFNILAINYASLFFWVSIILFSFSIVIIFEKASASILRNKLEVQQNTNKIKNFFIIKGAKLGLQLFEFSFGFNFKPLLLWFCSFIFWFFACLFLVAKASPLSVIFFTLMIIPWLMANVSFYKTSMDDFRGINSVLPNKVWYILLTAICVVLMVLGGNFVSLFEAMVLLTAYYLMLYTLPKKRK